MPQDPHALFDATVLDKIELSPVGAVPHTPAYQDALKRLYASHQVYANADHKDGHVTARSLRTSPSFHAENLEAFAAGGIPDTALEKNAAIFERYLKSLNAAQRIRAEAFRTTVPGKPIHHRKHAGVVSAPVIHDPVHTLFMVPGGGPHPGLPGNYLYGFLLEASGKQGSAPWAVHIHDGLDGVELYEAMTLADAFEKLQELIVSAPFHLEELAELGFRAG
jgi:hypothetical protein